MTENKRQQARAVLCLILLLSAAGTAVSQATPECPGCYGGVPTGNDDVRVLSNAGYTVGYDDSLRNPVWVAFRLMRVASPPALERLSSFTIDERTSALVSPEAYANTGFVRAQMAPQDAIGHSYGPAAQRETLLMSNVSPQRSTLYGFAWAALENLARTYANAFGQIWVITGPVFCSPQEILPSGVVVPCKFFQIIVDLHETGARALAFLVPQDAPTGASLTDYLGSIREVEQQTGLTFFPSLPGAVQANLKSQRAQELWPFTTRTGSTSTQAPSASFHSGDCCDKFISSRDSGTFHQPGCIFAEIITFMSSFSLSQKVCFCTREDALASGRSPCPLCRP